MLSRMNTSVLLEHHAHSGARLTLGPAGETLLTYGDVPAEYRAATQAAMVFDRTDRGRLRVGGKDAMDLLHRVTANRVKGLEAGDGNRGLLLNGKGKVIEEFDLLFLGADEGFALSTPPGRAASLLGALDMYLFTEDVSLTDDTESYAPLELIGPEATGVLARALGIPSEEATVAALLERAAGSEPHQQPSLVLTPTVPGLEPVRITALAVAGRPGLRLEASPAQALGLWSALVAAGARPGGLAMFDILRVEACSAAFGVDIDDTVYPQEARLEQAFNLEKGCYIGQEVVAKIDTYGGLNKRLCALQTGEDPVAPGTRLFREDPERGWRDLGVVTSWSWSFALDTGCALAYVKRRHQEPGTSFRLAAPGVTEDMLPVAPEATIVETPLEPAANPA